MQNPPTGGNGVIPITCVPPADVPPTVSDYNVCLGALEVIPNPADPVPPSLLGLGLPAFSVAYAFSEYYWEEQSGVATRVPIPGETIDWSSSQLGASGSTTVELGVTRQFHLAGKSYVAQKYTYLEFACVLDEGGVNKSASWVVRMKHF